MAGLLQLEEILALYRVDLIVPLIDEGFHLVLEAELGESQ